MRSSAISLNIRFERTGSQCTARSEIGTPQVSPFLPLTRVIAQAKRIVASIPVSLPTRSESAPAIASRQ